MDIWFSKWAGVVVNETIVMKFSILKKIGLIGNNKFIIFPKGSVVISFFMLLFALFTGCQDNIQYIGEIDGVVIQNGMMLSIGVPKRPNKFSDRIPIAVTNISSDTIYFRNMFIFSNKHPIFGDIELHIFDEVGKKCPENLAFIHYYDKLKRTAEFVVLPPKASYKDEIVLNLGDRYNLEKGKVYTIFFKYHNSSIHSTNFYPEQIPSGKLLWVGQLKSNTIKIRY